MSTDKTKPAVKLVLGSQATTFPLRVEIPLLDGSITAITFTCKAMRKTDLAKAKDRHHQTALKQTTARSDGRPSDLEGLIQYLEENGTASVVQHGMDSDANFILLFATAWDLADELSAENLMLLEDECGGSFRRIMEAYDAAIFQGRLGN